jgi:hypothetical protein
LKLGAREGSYAPWWRETEVVLYGQAANASATLDGKPVSVLAYDAVNRALRVRIPEQAGGGELRVKSK